MQNIYGLVQKQTKIRLQLHRKEAGKRLCKQRGALAGYCSWFPGQTAADGAGLGVYIARSTAGPKGLELLAGWACVALAEFKGGEKKK